MDIWLACLLDICSCHKSVHNSLKGTCPSTAFSIHRLEDEEVSICDYCDRPKDAVILAHKFCRCGKMHTTVVPDFAPKKIKEMAEAVQYYPCAGDCFGREKSLRPVITETVPRANIC